MSDALFYIIALAATGYFFWMWLQDYRANVRALEAATDGGSTEPAAESIERICQGGLPGATPVGIAAVAIAIVGALGLLSVEVAGEYQLDVVNEQTEMPLLLGIYSLAAAFVEELIFRGFLYYDRGGKWKLYASIVLISLVFALIHPYIWKYEVPEGEPPWFFWKWLSLNVNTKSLFSTAILFFNSLWFYFVRFFRLNPYRSLIPCFAAHLASNLGVFVVKACQGFVVWGLDAA